MFLWSNISNRFSPLPVTVLCRLQWIYPFVSVSLLCQSLVGLGVYLWTDFPAVLDWEYFVFFYYDLTEKLPSYHPTILHNAFCLFSRSFRSFKCKGITILDFHTSSSILSSKKFERFYTMDETLNEGLRLLGYLYCWKLKGQCLGPALN